MKTQVAASETVRSVGGGASPPRHLLAVRQLCVVIVVGVVFWYLGTVLVRFGTERGFCGGRAGLLTFLLTIPGSWPALWFIKKIIPLQPSQVVTGIAVGTAVAICCDGIALTWWPAFYGTDPAKIVLAAAWVLWGGGVLLGLAYLDECRHAMRSH